MKLRPRPMGIQPASLHRPMAATEPFRNCGGYIGDLSRSDKATKIHGSREELPSRKIKQDQWKERQIYNMEKILQGTLQLTDLALLWDEASYGAKNTH